MSILVDLHVHSNHSSDGELPPCDLVRLAARNGFRAIAISDHDIASAYPEALDCGRAEGVEVIPSIELTTLFDGREFHLLLPFIDWSSAELSVLLRKAAEARLSEAQERVEGLVTLGLPITWDEVKTKAGRTLPLGVSIAAMLLEKDEARSIPALAKYFEPQNWSSAPYLFYQDYFMEGKPAFVPKRMISLLDVLDASPRTGGVPVLSHPGAYFQQTTQQDLVVLKEAGLRGVEVYTPYHNDEQTSLYRGLAETLGLVPTAGSDFHGKIKPHITFGYIRDGRYWMVEQLRNGRAT